MRTHRSSNLLMWSLLTQGYGIGGSDPKLEKQCREEYVSTKNVTSKVAINKSYKIILKRLYVTCNDQAKSWDKLVRKYKS